MVSNNAMQVKQLFQVVHDMLDYAFLVDRLIGLYAATAGTVYVGAKILATNVRIADDPNRRGRERIY